MQDGYYSGNQIIIKFDEVKGVSVDESPRGLSVDIFLECHKLSINGRDAINFIASYKRYLREKSEGQYQPWIKIVLSMIVVAFIAVTMEFLGVIK